MASDDLDHPKLPRATLRGEELFLEGDPKPYRREPDYLICFEVDALTISGGYQPAELVGGAREPEGTMVPTVPQLHGTAKLEGRDKFAAAGLETNATTPIYFSLGHAADTDIDFLWGVRITFWQGDWEWEREEQFRVFCYVPRNVFAEILATVRTGRVEKLRVCMTTTMWTQGRSSAFVRVPMTWSLVPSTDHSEPKRHAIADGIISSMTWTERYSREASEPPQATTMELPTQLYSMLGAIIAIGAAMLVLALVFMRR
jgi:hypothetical protein